MTFCVYTRMTRHRTCTFLCLHKCQQVNNQFVECSKVQEIQHAISANRLKK